MYRKIEYRLARLQEPAHREVLYGGLFGLEKEGLRVDVGGGIAQTPHPEALGSALTHPYITTDYSEALLEFITPPITPPESALAFLRDIHTFIYGKLKDELLWATSVPCVVKGPDAIPIARYGHSNPGIMKTVYRRGLGHRYGRVMQVIAGVHFNYSLPETFWPVYQALEGDGRSLREFADDAYMGMIRNLQRFGWLVPYLFGASPAVCKSFLCGRPTTLEEFDETTYYEPYATSLRMGDIGYQNSREQTTGMKANYDSLDAYVRSLTWAIETPCPEYEAIGVVVDGRYEQLNANILQIENEYYSTVRPKQVLEDNEKPSLALKRRGVRYVELRSLDVNAFHPLGMDESQVHFLKAFMLFCL
ncbi:MAG TPA: glutamate--cysteine ligase, partial [Chromatiales bacterium]|nr:glutamate--cysteine ligase [Chromatiales bacterium]